MSRGLPRPSSGDDDRAGADSKSPASSTKPARGRRAALPPSHRPTWLLLLSSVTLTYGGLLLVSSLSTLRDPQAAAHVPLTEPMAPAVEALWKQLTLVSAGVIARHLVAIRVSAAGSLLVALAMLYAAAAALSRDRHGRAATLGAAWLGIAYQLSSLAVVIPVAREFAGAAAPVLAALLAGTRAAAAATGGGPVPADPGGDGIDAGPWVGDGAGMSVEAAARLGQSAIVGIPVLMAVIGVAGSLLLILYFGGRRGRVLYGLDPVRIPMPLPQDGQEDDRYDA